MYLTLQEWNARQAKPRSAETVRRWVRNCQIMPPPKKDGREYLFDEKARKIDRSTHPRVTLTDRIKNGKKKRL